MDEPSTNEAQTFDKKQTKTSEQTEEERETYYELDKTIITSHICHNLFA